ncbi:MAG: methyltransferase domain-containing protein [Cyanobacteria bacterium M_surface_9_m1_291]|nr:methyltransferase domain-containing protein [Cyanobacteria bacterium K_Offshore_0m_m2_072]MBM5808477.1 methyltransferase domain-containing protein [Cyanobacteria bacterium M_surface_9_m1_291]
MPLVTPAEPAPLAPVGLRPRLLAWQVLQAVAGGAYADGALERVLQRAGQDQDQDQGQDRHRGHGAQALSGADRALVTELAYGTIRQQGLLNGWLDQLGKVPASRQPPKLRWVLQLGAYQLLFCSSIPAAAAVNTAVELARQVGLARLAPVVNGLLRELDRRHRRAVARAEAADAAAVGTTAGQEAPGAPWLGLELPQDPAASLALRRSLPLWIAEALLSWLAQPEAEAVAAASNAAPRLDLRVNALRSSPKAVQEALAAAGVLAAPLAGLPWGLELQGRSGDLRQLPGYGEGHWSVQDRSAQQVVQLLDPQPGEWILDACAAPGGKAIQMAELCLGDTHLWAVDRSEARLRRLQRNAERLGVAGAIQVLAADATALPQRQPDWLGRFDRILLDAPCSGLGTLARHADARWRLTPAAIDELAALQDRLLAALAPLLRPGGWLVYATCTVHSRENSERVNAFVLQHPHWRLLQHWQRWPGDGDGFYAALLQAPA